MEQETWYAIYTKSRSEKRVAEQMKATGFTVYLPLVKTLRQWSDRKKKVEVPLISSYVFVKVSERDYYNILNTQGVVRYVTFEGKAAPIPEKQIIAMQMAVDNEADIEISTEQMAPGEQVKVINGPLKGAEGEYVFGKGKRSFVIRLNHMGYALKVEVPASDVAKL